MPCKQMMSFHSISRNMLSIDILLREMNANMEAAASNRLAPVVPLLHRRVHAPAFLLWERRCMYPHNHQCRMMSTRQNSHGLSERKIAISATCHSGIQPMSGHETARDHSQEQPSVCTHCTFWDTLCGVPGIADTTIAFSSPLTSNLRHLGGINSLDRTSNTC